MYTVFFFLFRLKIHFRDLIMQLEQLMCYGLMILPQPSKMLKIWSPLMDLLTGMNSFRCCVRLKLVQNWVQEPRLTVTQLLRRPFSRADSRDFWNR